MGKVIVNIFLGALAVGLTIFTGARTLDLLGQWLPLNQQIMQYLGLAAFEAGFYFWAGYYAFGAKGAPQRAISLIMIVLSFVGIAIATVTDLLLDGANTGKLPDLPVQQKEAIVVFIGVIIVLHVAAFMAVKLLDPERMKAAAVQDAEDQIHAAELELIRKVAPHVASQAAPIMAERWVAETWQKLLPGTVSPMKTVTGSVASSMPPVAAPAPPRGILGKVAGLFGGGQQQAPASLAQTATVQQPANVPPTPANKQLRPAGATTTTTRPSVADARRKHRQDRLRPPTPHP
jgi:hypothetical protein